MHRPSELFRGLPGQFALCGLAVALLAGGLLSACGSGTAAMPALADIPSPTAPSLAAATPAPTRALPASLTSAPPSATAVPDTVTSLPSRTPARTLAPPARTLAPPSDVPPTAVPPTQVWDPQALAGVDAAARQALGTIPLAGLSLAVRQGTRPIYAQGYGRADIDRAVQAGPDTLYEMASLSKQFTAAAILQLAESGRLDLADQISSYVPNLPAVAAGITIRDLLNHTSGLPDSDYLYVALALPQVYTPTDVSAFYFKGLKSLDFKPGTRWEYSNMGYFLLSMIVERASGQPFGTYLQQNVFAPAGLAATSYCPQLPPGLAQGYQVSGSDFQPMKSDNLSLYMGAGGLCTTAPDLVRWQQALASGRVVSDVDYQAMTSPAKLPSGKPLTYGYGLRVGAYGGQLAVYHQGQVPGFSAVLVYYPGDDIAVALLTNTQAPIALLDALAGQIRAVLTAAP
jgi:D-alanyl-D-alanine carboxypeptidase